MLFALLGSGLLFAWLTAMLTGASPWLRWVDFVAGSFSFLVAMSPIFTGTVGRRDSAGYAWSLSALLFGFGLVMFPLHATPWLTWSTIGFATLYAGAAMLLRPRRA